MDYSDEALNDMSWRDLWKLRNQVTNNQPEQNRVANYEHQAYAREATKENPMMAVPIAAAIPAYQVYKGVMGGSRSEGGLQQIGHGYIGIMQGLRDGLLAKMYPQGNN